MMASRCVAVAALAASGCSAAALNPERLAANIEVRPRAMAVAPGQDFPRLTLRAAVDACNRNDVDIELKRADWTAELEGRTVGSGTVAGPRTLPAGQCVNLPVSGALDMALLGGAALGALLQGRDPIPALLVDVTAGVYGFSLRRTVKLSADAFLAVAARPQVGK